MNKVLGFGLVILSILMGLNVLMQLYKLMTVADATIGALGILALIGQFVLAVIFWFASRVFLKMG